LAIHETNEALGDKE
jgi:hypothetical protein